MSKATDPTRPPLVGSEEHHLELAAEERRLLEFGRAAQLPEGAFGWLDSRGRPTPGRPAYLYVTCRMTHTYALARLQGLPGAAELADHGLAALTSMFHDPANGGWFTAVGPGGERDDRKWSYPHGFVVLAAATATVAGRPGARELLDEATDVLDRRFWDDEAGMLVEEWDATFTTLSHYRGANSNMHGVEAMLAAHAATGQPLWLERAVRVSGRMVREAAEHGWRLPEHYDEHWAPLLEHNREHPADPFQPYGATPGHSLEWARLLLQVRAGLAASGQTPPAWLLDGARSLAETAVRDAWSVDGAPGFVYTVDWTGRPVIRQRLHWVLCEALGAAAVLWKVTGEDRYARWYSTWWHYGQDHLVDVDGGSWHHELNPDNRPDATIRDGKADLYHAVQATLLPRLDVTPALATAVATRYGEDPPATP